VGYGINWFHSAIWQGLLLAADIPLPKRVFAHSHYNVAGQKMSKSIGNVISPEELVTKFGVDGTRYLIAKTFPSADDSDITWEKLIETYNADLANNIGNLVSRLSRLAEGMEIDSSSKLQLEKKFCELLDTQDFSGSIEFILREIIDPVNLLLNQEKPWGMPPEDPSRQEILRRCILEVVRAGYHLQVIMPGVGAEIIKRLGTGKVTYQKEGLFPRL
jgi:methionyl-tRNA synthetase